MAITVSVCRACWSVGLSIENFQVPTPGIDSLVGFVIFLLPDLGISSHFLTPLPSPLHISLSSPYSTSSLSSLTLLFAHVYFLLSSSHPFLSYPLPSHSFPPFLPSTAECLWGVFIGLISGR